jgi:DNA-binding FadR family transcriptional regulator
MSNLFEPIEIEPAYRRVAATIERKIMARDLNDGDTLPAETDLARQFRVNRSTVREALRELQSKGLVARREGRKRLYIAHPQAADVASGVSRALALHGVTFLEVWEAMMIVEPQAAALCTPARDRASRGAVALSARFEAAGSDSARSVPTVKFFRTARCTQNHAAIGSGAAHRLLSPTLARMIDQVRRPARIVAAQRHLIEAIRSRTPRKHAAGWKSISDFRAATSSLESNWTIASRRCLASGSGIRPLRWLFLPTCPQ